MSDVATSQPPPATDGGTPWGSFYTASNTGAAPAPPKAKRKRGAEPKPKGEKKTKGEKKRSRSRGSLTGGARREEDRRRSFSLRRGPREERPQEPAPAPVAAAARSRRYAEPHVLVGVVGGTIIALAALMIALLYMIGTAA